jgi:hypothetical protein
VPHSRVALSAKERDALIEPPEQLPQGHRHPNGYGFTLEGVVMGGY